jgi:DNA-damage-inducible protein D
MDIEDKQIVKNEFIAKLFKQFEEIYQTKDGIEYWLARDLQKILGYSEWRNFRKVVEKAQKACEQAGLEVKDQFYEFSKQIETGKGALYDIDDFALTRYACYLIAQNGDPTKPEIAFAQTYFAVQTRKQEIIEKRLLEIERVTAREKLSQSEKRLSGIIFERGGTNESFAIIRSKGDQALFGGKTTSDMKQILDVPQGRPLADFLPTLTIKVKDVATEMTSHNVIEKNLNGEPSITKEHIDNNTAMRNMLVERGIKPEQLPPDEDVKKVERRLKSETQKVLNDVKKKHKKRK